MKQIDIALRHIKVLYVALLFVITANIGYGLFTYNFDDIIISAKEGYADGSRAADDSHRSELSIIKLYEILYNPTIKAVNKQIITSEDASTVEIETSAFDVRLISGKPISGWLNAMYFIFGLIGCIAGVWAIVLTIRMVINLGRSIVRKDIFNPKTIRLCRWYALMIAIYSVSFGFHVYIKEVTVAPYLDGTQWEFIPSFPLDLSTLTVALMIYMFSEILKIGGILKQEQELTI